MLQLARKQREAVEAKLSLENAALTKELAHLRTELLDVDEDLEQLTACNRYHAGRIGEQEAELQSLRARTDAKTSDPAGEAAGPKSGGACSTTNKEGNTGRTSKRATHSGISRLH